MSKIICFKKLRPDAITPKYMTKGAVAFDISSVEYCILDPGDKAFIHTGLAFQVPEGYEMTVRQRSGISLKFPNYITIGVGTIDTDYRGEIMIPVKNNNPVETFSIVKGLRLAQCVVSPIEQCKIVEVDELDETVRGSGGFGHTG